MSARRLIFALLLLACGFAAGLVLTGRMRQTSEVVAQTPRATPGTAPVTVTNAGTPDFTRVAERTVPAVANISSQQVVRRPNSPYSNDPLFRYFFGDDPDVFGGRRGVESSLGSGVVISADGYILTNSHVVIGEPQRGSVRNLPQITVGLADQREMQAAIVGVDPDTDLALLKIDARNLPTIPWGDSDRLRVAEWVMAIGNPFQLNQTVTLGIVSAVGRTNIGVSAYEDFIQTDAAINPGNSGGALVNARGELIGINTAIFSQSGGYQGIGFAVPSRLARRVVADLQQFGQVQRGSIGYVQIAPLTAQLARELGAPDTRGVLITQMMRRTPAFQSGLRPGDIIVTFNGTEIADGEHLTRLIGDAPIGKPATVGIIREGRRLQVQVPIELVLNKAFLTGLPSNWPELTLALALAVVVAYLVADFVARTVRRLLRAVIADPQYEALFVERPRRVVRLVIFLVTAVALSFPALRLAGVRTDFGGNPDALLRWLLDAGLRIVVISIGAYLIIRIGSAAARRFESEMSHGTGLDILERTKRAQTLGRLIQHALTIVVFAIAALMVLRELDVDITPVLTGAGIVGLAVGFGAQTLVRDIISGFFLILEDQVRVGDVAAINGQGGLVEEVNLRTIVLRDETGTVHVFPNGEVKTLANLSKDFSFYVITVKVPSDVDPDLVADTMKDAAGTLLEDLEFKPSILAPLEVYGVDSWEPGALTIKARIKTVPLKQWFVGRELRKRIARAFNERHIPVPIPETKITLERRAERDS